MEPSTPGLSSHFQPLLCRNELSSLVSDNHAGRSYPHQPRLSVSLIRANVERLGFHFSDIKIILISHAHDDHAAGCTLAKKLTGAKLIVMDGDVEEVEGGGAGDFQCHQHWAPAKVDRILRDGNDVTLGGTTLIAHLTPGQKKGCTTWTTEMKEGGHVYHVVIVGSPNVNPGYKLIGNSKYSQIATDYEKTFRVLASLPCVRLLRRARSLLRYARQTQETPSGRCR